MFKAVNHALSLRKTTACLYFFFTHYIPQACFLLPDANILQGNKCDDIPTLSIIRFAC